MAKIITEGIVREWGVVANPKCSGCGEEFYYTPYGLDSKLRYHAHLHRHYYGAAQEAGKGGTKGPEIAEWAKKHEACPEPVEEVLPSGIHFIDRRKGREP
jgi:hypothetical protein